MEVFPSLIRLKKIFEMNKILKLVLGLFVATTFVACEDLKDNLPNIEIPINQETTIEIEIPVGDTSIVFNREESIAAIKDLQENADKLEKIEADSVTFKFNSLTGGNGGNGSNASFEGEIKSYFGSTGSADQLLELIIGDGVNEKIDLQTLVNQPEKTVTAAEANKIVEMLNALASTGATFITEINGSASNSATEAYRVNLTFTIYAEATAKP